MARQLVAYNVEHWLVNRLLSYLDGPDEYRANTRHLLHTSGVVHYRHDSIHVELNTADNPRNSRAVGLLLDELKNTQAHIFGDRRPLTYVPAPSRLTTSAQTHFRRSASRWAVSRELRDG